MFAAFHFPALPLTCLLDNTQEPAALLSGSNREKSHITQLNKAALAYELTPGMRTTRALARCPDLKLHEANPTLEASAHHMILGFIDTLSPDYEVTRCDTFILDLSTLVIASEEEWLSSTRSKTSTLDFPLHIGLADTPDLAHLTSLKLPHQDSSLAPPTINPPSTSTLTLLHSRTSNPASMGIKDTGRFGRSSQTRTLRKTRPRLSPASRHHHGEIPPPLTATSSNPRLSGSPFF